MTDPRAALERGLKDRYTIERELGRGGMATVYLAQDLKHDRQVAIKVMLPEIAAVLGNERFQREIGLAAKLPLAGRPAKADQLLQRGQSRNSSEAVRQYKNEVGVRTLLMLGRNDEALTLIENDRLNQYLSKGYLRLHPEFQGLRGNPRFEKLIK